MNDPVPGSSVICSLTCFPQCYACSFYGPFPGSSSRLFIGPRLYRVICPGLFKSIEHLFLPMLQDSCDFLTFLQQSLESVVKADHSRLRSSLGFKSYCHTISIRLAMRIWSETKKQFREQRSLPKALQRSITLPTLFQPILPCTYSSLNISFH